MPLLEREDELAVLVRGLAAAADRRGRIVLLHGPAGIGKTALVRAFAETVTGEDATVRAGACDDLITTRAFAPFRDIAGRQSRLGLALHTGADPAEVLDAILEELDDPLRPVVWIIEDLQWADDATLDALMVVARRIDRLPALLVATFRDDDIDRRHPLRRMLGALGAAGVERIALTPLSRDAVGRLVGRAEHDVDTLYRVTGGNPFYVLEMASAPDDAVPTSVRDAVLTRVLALPEATQRALEALSVIPSRAERWLLDAVVDGGGQAFDAAERSGLVTADAASLRFTHEIARRAVASDLATGTRITLNAAVTAVLIAHDADATRILHHALEAGDGGVVLRYGPIAAREAARLGSHREALSAYRQLHRFTAALPPGERAALALEYAYELQLGNRHSDAVSVASEAVALLEQHGDAPALADALLVLSRAAYWWRGTAAAMPHAERAVGLLQAGEPSPVLAMAFAHMSRMHLLANRNAEAGRWAARALGVAGRVGHLPAEAGARINHGAAALNLGDEGGLAEVEEGLRLARRHGFHESVVRGYYQLVVEHIRRGGLDAAERVLDEGRAYAADHQVAYGTFRFDGLLGCLALNRGANDEARSILERSLVDEVDPGMAGVQPRAWLAQALARMGEPKARGHAQRAWELAADSAEAPLLGAAAAALVELAWLSGDADGAGAAAERALALADETGHPWYAGDLRVALLRAGLPVPDAPDPGRLLGPHLAALRGDHAAAASAWERLGYRHEQAVELTLCEDEAAMLRGVRLLDELGAAASANVARALLRSRGVSSVPRGPTRATRQNPAGLTDRQMDVLALVAEGLTNAEIADRLVVSVRTVDHHVSAILDKLAVSTRQEAAAMVVELGLTG